MPTKPAIVVADGYALNPGDLDWQPIEALGTLTVHDRTSADQVVARCRDADVVLTNKVAFTAVEFAALPKLRYVGVTATGVNVVDLEAAKAHSVTVTNVPGYGNDSVAQHVLALLLELVSKVGQHNEAVHAGRWVSSPDWCFTVGSTHELAGKTLGIVGMGRIGRRVAQIAAALGMRIAAAHQSSMDSVRIAGVDVTWMELDDLFAAADVLTLHCPLTEQTRGLVSAEHLAKMKPTAYLINTGRGPLVDEAALAAALRENRLAGAGLDVLGDEPPREDNPLLAAPRCILTPHVAWASVEARRRLMTIAAENLKAFLAGQPVNVVA